DDCAPTPCTEGDGCGADGCASNIWGSFGGAGTNVCAAKSKCTENECVANCEADGDKDLYSESCGDCDDTNKKIRPPDVSELEEGMIDGLDNDCDGVVDDSLVGGEEVEVSLSPELRLEGRYSSIREKLNWFLLLMLLIVAFVIILTVHEYHKHVRRLQRPRRGAPPEEYPGVSEQPMYPGQQPPMYPGQPPMQP
ncbi:MAG: putative metal-binding motif-containing protein, partial [Candidatus Omnitrophota bacterium]